MHSNAASEDGTRRRSNHSSIGTSAIAMTRAAVTGRKKAAPERNANGAAMRKPRPQNRAIAASSRSRRSESIS